MLLQRLAVVSGLVVLGFSAVALLAWWALAPLLQGLHHSQVLRILPMEALALALCAIGLLACRFTSGRFARRIAILAGVLPTILLVEILFGFEGGIEGLLVPDDTHAWQSGSSSWRPGIQTSLTLLMIAGGLWFGSERNRRDQADVDAGDVLAGAALFLPFIALLGHLFQAQALFAAGAVAGAGMSVAVAALLLALAGGLLALKPAGGLLARYTATSAGGEASRRLAPAAIFIPVMIGLLQIYAVRWDLLQLPLAVALSVSISVLVFLALIHWVSQLLTQLEAQRLGLHEQQVSEVKEEGMTDALTGLYNRRGWEHHLQLQEAHCARRGLNACVMVVDLDNLKQINDTLGHTEGDDLIARAGQALRRAARESDVLARLGGDEFACLAVGVEPHHAEIYARRLAAALTAAKVQASIGYAMRDLNASLKGAFDEADRLMYAEKRSRKAAKAAEPSRAVGG